MKDGDIYFIDQYRNNFIFYVLAIAMIERHGKSKNIGFEDMALCANKLRELQGGIVNKRTAQHGQKDGMQAC